MIHNKENNQLNETDSEPTQTQELQDDDIFFFEMTTFKQLFNYISHAQNLKDIENLKI